MLTKKAKYGLKAMTSLAGFTPGRPVPVSALADANAIPKKFLDAILGELRDGGLVQTKKGPGGGVMLARAPAAIRVGEIVRILDGPLAPIACASKTAYRRCLDCADERACSVRLMMIEVRNAIAAVLDERTLADMRALIQREAIDMYYI